MQYTKVQLSLQHAGAAVPPDWATGEQNSNEYSLFVNEHGEPWVARRIEDVLLLSGLDVGWEEIRLSLEEAEAELGRISRYLQTGQSPLPLSWPDLPREVSEEVAASREEGETPYNVMSVGPWVVGVEEALWMAAVISSNLPAMRVARRRKSE